MSPDVHPAPAGDDTPAWPDDAVEVGRVLGAWGVKGGLKVKPYAADPQALFSSKRWFIQPPATPRPGPPTHVPSLLRVQQAREQGDAIVATCHELTDRDAAQRLAGARIFVPRSSFPSAEPDEYYWVDLIGLDVRDRAGDRLGVVSALLETGPQSVLCVAPPVQGADELLIPFVNAYVDRVDLPGRTVHVDWQADWQADR